MVLKMDVLWILGTYIWVSGSGLFWPTNQRRVGLLKETGASETEREN